MSFRAQREILVFAGGRDEDGARRNHDPSLRSGMTVAFPGEF